MADKKPPEPMTSEQIKAAGEIQRAWTPPNDEAIKAAVLKAAADLKMSATSKGPACLALVRLLGETGAMPDKAKRIAVAQWLIDGESHGLGCNASQLGQFVTGKSEKASVKLARELDV